MEYDSLIADLIRAGVAPDLVGRVAAALADAAARSEGALTLLARHRSVNAVRQARFRASKQSQAPPDVTLLNVSNVTADASRAPARDNLQLSQNTGGNLLPLLKKDNGAGKKSNVTERGTRLPEDWKPSDKLRAFAHSLGLTDRQIDIATAGFHDYWKAIPGKQGRKVDWDATFRNDIRDRVAPRLKKAGELYLPTSTRSLNGKETVFVKLDSEQWIAWDRYLKATKGHGAPSTRSGGWHFPTEWPPDANLSRH